MLPTDRIRQLIAAATVAGSLTVVPAASATPDLVVPRSSSLSAPTGVAQTPDGAYWVADALMGICRVDPERNTVVPDIYCGDEHVVAEHVGPAKATGLAFDLATSNFYSGDLQSNQGAVWRLHWDASTGTIDRAGRVLSVGDDRVTAVTLEPVPAGEPGRVLYATKRSNAIMRIDDPTAAQPTAVTAGLASREASSGLAVLDGRAYVATGGSLERFSLAGRLGVAATEVSGTAGLPATAVTADAGQRRVYVGTTFPELTDDIAAIDPDANTIETYETGFTGITGLGVDRDGGVLVADDPGLAVDALDSASQGRLMRVAFHALGRSRTNIVAAPPVYGSAGAATFRFAAEPGATFRCRLDGGEWAACGDVGTGTVTYEDLAPGTHVFEVRGTNVAGEGNAARRVFVIDATAPRVTVTAPADGGAVVRGSGRIEMTADELYVSYECAIDDAAPVPCEPGEELPGLELGEHSLQVFAEDAAGNRGAAAPVRFTVADPPPAPRTPEQPPAPEPQPSTEITAATSAPPVAPPAAGEVHVQGFVAAAPSAGPGARLLPPTISRPRGRATLTMQFGVPVTVTAARIGVSVGVKPGRKPFVTRVLPVRSGAVNRVEIALTKAESKRLRPGRYRVTVSLTGGPQVMKLTVLSTVTRSGAVLGGR
jgi:hypothetical protein